MSCKVEGCHQPIYHHNPLVSPLLSFHGMVINLGSELPSVGKAAEIVKRIAVAVASPFAYLALAFVALAGLMLDGIWEHRHVSQGGVSKQGEKALAGIASEQAVSGKASQLPLGAFGKNEWEKTFPVTIEEVPPLPPNIHEILEQEDPCEPGKTLKETCQLFLRPQKIILHEEGNDKELALSFDGVEELATSATNPDRRMNFETFDELRGQLNQMPVAEAGWVLMRKEVIPGTGGKNFKSQKGLLKGGFEVPKLMDAILLSVLYFASEGKRHFGENPCTFTRCQEKYLTHQTIVGGIGPSGLHISMCNLLSDSLGLAGAWKL